MLDVCGAIEALRLNRSGTLYPAPRRRPEVHLWTTGVSNRVLWGLSLCSGARSRLTGSGFRRLIARVSPWEEARFGHVFVSSGLRSAKAVNSLGALSHEKPHYIDGIDHQ